MSNFLDPKLKEKSIKHSYHNSKFTYGF